MTRQELELKAKEFDSKLKRHPMSSEELQNVLCDFVEALHQPHVVGRSEQLTREQLLSFFNWYEYNPNERSNNETIVDAYLEYIYIPDIWNI